MTQIQIRRGNASAWTAANPILAHCGTKRNVTGHWHLLQDSGDQFFKHDVR